MTCAGSHHPQPHSCIISGVHVLGVGGGVLSLPMGGWPARQGVVWGQPSPCPPSLQRTWPSPPGPSLTRRRQLWFGCQSWGRKASEDRRWGTRPGRAASSATHPDLPELSGLYPILGAGAPKLPTAPPLPSRTSSWGVCQSHRPGNWPHILELNLTWATCLSFTEGPRFEPRELQPERGHSPGDPPRLVEKARGVWAQGPQPPPSVKWEPSPLPSGGHLGDQVSQFCRCVYPDLSQSSNSSLCRGRCHSWIPMKDCSD